MKNRFFLILVILLVLNNVLVQTVFAQQESVILTPSPITSRDSTNIDQKGLKGTSASESPFYYYVNGKQQSLTPSKEWISIQYPSGGAKGITDLSTTISGYIDTQNQVLEIPNPKITLVPIKNLGTSNDVVDAIQKMRASETGMVQINPVFETQDARMVVTDEFIVHFLPQFSQSEIEDLNKRNNVEVVKAIPDQGNAFILRVLPRAGIDALTMANRYQESEHCINSAPNFLRLIPTLPEDAIQPKNISPSSTPNDYWYYDQWYLNNVQQYGTDLPSDVDIDAPEAWDISTGSTSITIAIVDEGVDLNHEDLRDKMVTGYDATGGGSGGGYQNNDGHGTSVAGIAAAMTNNSLGVAGVCQNCKIMPIRIAYSHEDGYWVTYDSWIADAITWAYQHGADVINNSWGGGSDSYAITLAFDQAKDIGRGGKGCVVIASAGNGNQEYVIYPSRINSVISVGASNLCDQRKSKTNDLCNGNENWWGSSYGLEMDISAPGVWLDSTDITGAPGYSLDNYTLSFNGTSGAAPIISGVAGLILSVNPNLTADQVRNILLHTADDIDITGWDKYTGFGRVNAYKAVVKAQQSISNPNVIYKTKAKFDFDGDGDTDYAVFRPSNGTWYVKNQFNVAYGISGDIPVPGDYNADGRTDIAVFRPSNGTWYVKNQFNVAYGISGDIPVPGDYNGDGRTDVAVFRPSNGTWYVRGQFQMQYGLQGDIPVPRDYNGDGKTDIAVYRMSEGGGWHVNGQFDNWFGGFGGIPVPDDYDGDGKAEMAIFWLSWNSFQFLDHPDMQFSANSSFTPVPGDYNGDGKTDGGGYLPTNSEWQYMTGFADELGYHGDLHKEIYGTLGDYPIPQTWRGVTTTAPVESDYNGDNRTDVPVFNASLSFWSQPGMFDFWYFGEAGDRRVPGDFDGDGLTDPTVFRPSNGTWYTRNRRLDWYSYYSEVQIQYGTTGDIPVPADYNADGKSDIGVFRPSNNTWYIRNQFNTQWGLSGDIPVPADYNADGKADIAVFRPSTGTWWIKDQFSTQYGKVGDIPIPADYNGDGKADVAVYRQYTDGTWSWHVQNQYTIYGGIYDIPIHGDFDGDGKTEVSLLVAGR